MGKGGSVDRISLYKGGILWPLLFFSFSQQRAYKRNAKRGVFRKTFSYLLLASLTLPTIAYAQSLSQQQLKVMPPEALIQTWESTSGSDRQLVEEAILENRSSSLPALREAVMIGSSQVKMFAAAVLAEMRDKESVSSLPQ